MISVPLKDYLFRDAVRGGLLLLLHWTILFEIMRYLYKGKQNYGLVAGSLYPIPHIKNLIETESFP